MKQNAPHILLAAALIISLALLSDPFMIWMPPAAATAALLAAAAIMCVWIGFIARERGGDERDLQHRMNAGRAAYLSGLAVLTVALIVQGFAHQIDVWVAVALAAMVVSKLAARIYFERNG